MMRKTRSLICGVIAAALMGIASGASALTVAPAGSFSGTAGTTTFTFQPNLVFICRSSTVSGTITPTGSAAGSSLSTTFSGCNSPPLYGSSGLGPVDIVQNAPATISLVRNGSEVDTTFGGISLHVTYADLGCSMDLKGSEVVRSPGASPLVISNFAVTGAAPSGLVSANVVGCTPLFFNGFNHPILTANYALTPAQTVTG